MLRGAGVPAFQTIHAPQVKQRECPAGGVAACLAHQGEAFLEVGAGGGEIPLKGRANAQEVQGEAGQP